MIIHVRGVPPHWGQTRQPTRATKPIQYDVDNSRRSEKFSPFTKNIARRDRNIIFTDNIDGPGEVIFDRDSKPIPDVY